MGISSESRYIYLLVYKSFVNSIKSFTPLFISTLGLQILPLIAAMNKLPKVWRVAGKGYRL
jgi:hypothetical protein